MLHLKKEISVGHSHVFFAVTREVNPTEHWYLVRFAKTGSVRFLSQHDVRRTWERATRRGNLPLAYSRGFNPKPRLSFGPPLSVGAEGRREFMTMALREPLNAALVYEQLRDAAVPGMSVIEVSSVPGRRVQLTWGSYELLVADRPLDLPLRLDQLLKSTSVLISRPRDPEGRLREIRPGVGDLKLSGPDRIQARLKLASNEIVTPRDLALALNIEFLSTIRIDIAFAHNG